MSTPGNFDPNVPPPRQAGGGGSVLMIVLIVIGVLLLLCAGTCGGCLWIGQRAARQVGAEFGAAVELNPVMQRAIEVAKEDPQVIEQLGDGIGETSLPVRERTGEVDPVHESFGVQLHGSKGAGRLVGHATKVNGAWKLTEITLELADGSKVNVPVPEETAMELQFDVPPPVEETK